MRGIPFIGRLFGDRRGVAAVEFAFIAPVLILAYFGVAELCGAMLAERKAYHAASAIGDLVAQDAAPAGADITDIFSVASEIMAPYSTTGMNMRVSTVQMNAAGTQVTSLWSCGYGGYTAYPNGTVITLPNSSLIQANQSLVMAEVQYVYNSPVKYVLPNAMTYTEKSYLRPRLVDPIPDPGAPCT
jgi:Flp pilus assembly protein TadG